MSELEPVASRYQQALAAQRDSKLLLGRARARFAEKLHGVDPTAPSRWRFVLPTCGVLAAALAVGVFAWPEDALGVSLRGQPGQPVDFVQVGVAAEQVVDFSDGSEVLVRESSQLRVLGVTPQGAQVSLERGAARVAVVHRQTTKWVFSAGPYRVHVVGTKFELKWNPDTGGLEVEMDDGIVEVDGPGLSRQRVTSKQKLEAFAAPTSASLYLAAPPPAAPSEALEVELKRARVEKTRPSLAPVKPRLGPSWRYLADQGDAFGAMRAAELAGFTWLSNSMPAPDVLALGDVARQAKQPVRATEAWLAVRERFAGTVSASEAALRLGHLAEAQRDVEGALAWFARADRDAPNSPTAAQALGDALEVLVRAGRKEESRAVALEYVKRFKNGPDAAAAHAALGR